MFTVAHSVHLPAPLARVWRLLADIDRHAEWRQLVVLSGTMVRGGKIIASFRSRNGDVAYYASGHVVQLDRYSALAWRIGLKRVLQIEERFDLTKAEQGTMMVHRICFTGFISWLGLRFLAPRIKAEVIAADIGLARFLHRATTTARYSPPAR